MNGKQTNKQWNRDLKLHTHTHTHTHTHIYIGSKTEALHVK